MSEEHEEITRELATLMRTVMSTAMTMGEHAARARERAARAAQARSDQAAREYRQRAAAERTLAETRMRQTHRPGWWSEHRRPHEIAAVYRDAVAFAAVSPTAWTTKTHIESEVARRYGVDAADLARDPDTSIRAAAAKRRDARGENTETAQLRSALAAELRADAARRGEVTAQVRERMQTDALEDSEQTRAARAMLAEQDRQGAAAAQHQQDQQLPASWHSQGSSVEQGPSAVPQWQVDAWRREQARAWAADHDPVALAVYDVLVEGADENSGPAWWPDLTELWDRSRIREAHDLDAATRELPDIAAVRDTRSELAARDDQEMAAAYGRAVPETGPARDALLNRWRHEQAQQWARESGRDPQRDDLVELWTNARIRSELGDDLDVHKTDLERAREWSAATDPQAHEKWEQLHAGEDTRQAAETDLIDRWNTAQDASREPESGAGAGAGEPTREQLDAEWEHARAWGEQNVPWDITRVDDAEATLDAGRGDPAATAQLRENVAVPWQVAQARAWAANNDPELGLRFTDAEHGADRGTYLAARGELLEHWHQAGRPRTVDATGQLLGDATGQLPYDSEARRQNYGNTLASAVDADTADQAVASARSYGTHPSEAVTPQQHPGIRSGKPARGRGTTHSRDHERGR